MNDNAPISAAWVERYRAVSNATVKLCEPLQIEDYQLQSMPECSPPKWHLAHTTWFFETFLLTEFERDFLPHHPQFGYLFNSYYDAVGDRWPRSARGLLSRPTVAEVQDYRRSVDRRVCEFIASADEVTLAKIVAILELGLNHEQQHQELLLTDLKHAFSLNPLRPAYLTPFQASPGESVPLEWHDFPEGIREIGHDGTGFAFDNETPRHRVFLEGFQIASRAVTCGEFLEFIEDGGYRKPEFWLSDGWAECQRNDWQAPLYWETENEKWSVFTLHGVLPRDPNLPVCHVSYYEAEAFARWTGARLPTEAEWEVASVAGVLRSGEVWDWTASPYIAYHGYRPAAGAVGEYNGKFMCNQFVLRGGSSATPAGHIRSTYRNFFPPETRWQFTGLRLAKDQNG